MVWPRVSWETGSGLLCVVTCIRPYDGTRIPLTYRLKSCGTKWGVRYAINFYIVKKNKGQRFNFVPFR